MPIRQHITSALSGQASTGLPRQDAVAATTSAASGADGSVDSQQPRQAPKRKRALKTQDSSVHASVSTTPAVAATTSAASGADGSVDSQQPRQAHKRKRASKTQDSSAHASTTRRAIAFHQSAELTSSPQAAPSDTNATCLETVAAGHIPDPQESIVQDCIVVKPLLDNKSSSQHSAQKVRSTRRTRLSKMVVADSENESDDSHPHEASAGGVVTNPVPVTQITGLRRSGRSAAAAAVAEIKRTYEAYGEPLVEAKEALKKGRKQLPKAVSPSGESKAKAHKDSYEGSSSRNSMRTTRSKGKAPMPSVSSRTNDEEEEGEGELPVADYEEAVTVQSDSDGDADWVVEDEESQTSFLDNVELNSNATVDELLLHSDECLYESDKEADIDPVNFLIEDDEYISFEDDIEEFDESASLDDVERGDSESLHRPESIQSAEVDAAQWIQEYDESHPVNDDDADLQRFDTNFARLVQSLCDWAIESSKKGWHKLSRSQRELTFGFHALFQRAAADPGGLVRICLEGMPRQTRKVLGKMNLNPVDLLDLPTIPALCKHRLVYMDIATSLPEGQIRQVSRDCGCGPRQFKAANPSFDLKQALQVKLYVGSSVNKEGGYRRIRAHESIANGHFQEERNLNMHYTEVMKADVLVNFRLLGAWQNPYANKSYDGQDVSRWIAPMVEGLMMVYLGVYTKKNTVATMPDLFTLSSYDLVGRIRNGLSLPNFANISLNRAWSLVQGTGSGVKMAQWCANPECRRPRVISETTLVGTKPANKFTCIVSRDLLAPYYCSGCYDHYRLFGEVRTREGLATGRWQHEWDFEAINEAWHADGRERKCLNVECNVPIHSAANLYGIENGIRCLRCYKFALLHHREYSSSQDDEEQTGDCQVCLKANVRIFSWVKVDKRKGPELPSELCGGCYITRCSFLQDEVPIDARPQTIPGCDNPACWDYRRKKRAERGWGKLIENTDEHIWRCMRCDYCHEIGVDSFDKLEDLPKPPSGPIVSHRFNCTECINCERYISYDDWEKVERGYRCAACVGRRCADCNIDPAVIFMFKNLDGQVRCSRCHQKQLNKAGGLNHANDEKLQSRKCCNSHCSTTGRDTARWYIDPTDKSQYRCDRCYMYLQRHGREWAPVAECHNSDCDATGPDVHWATGPDGNTRCKPCLTALIRTGAERPCKARCHNFRVCGHEHTNYKKGFCRDTAGDDNVRCLQCHKHWVDLGRQFDRDPHRSRPTKAELKARVCSRPGCNAVYRTCKTWYRWKEFVLDGFVCEPCFKVLKARPSDETRSGPGGVVTPDNAVAAAPG